MFTAQHPLRQRLHAFKQQRQRQFRAFRLIRQLYRQSQLKQVTAAPALIVAPHPDDETLGCGGLIALKCQQGAGVKVVILTDGRASHANHPHLPTEQLIAMRQKEAAQALAILGVPPEDLHFLNQPDQGVATLPSEQHQAVLVQLVNLLQTFRPQEVYVTYRRDVHPDHEATYRLIRAAITQAQQPIDLYEYPIYTLWRPWLLDLKAEGIGTCQRISIRSVLRQKQQAIRVYRSQYQPIPPDQKAALPTGFIYRFMRPYELFFKAEPES
ncbi:MAG: PIG-L family deacetylase [Cyanobacteria bacterium Co-bin8]|nr:PIG-L family deacetylase [Cyanobacteria bacterium Co-bin8]